MFLIQEWHWDLLGGWIKSVLPNPLINLLNVTLAKFHEFPPMLLIFGPGLQIIIYLIILASKARHTNVMDITGAAALGRGPLWCR